MLWDGERASGSEAQRRSEQQYGVMLRKTTSDTMFAVRMLMEKYREVQKELYCVFVDLQKVYDRLPREELWFSVRESLAW